MASRTLLRARMLAEARRAKGEPGVPAPAPAPAPASFLHGEIEVSVHADGRVTAHAMARGELCRELVAIGRWNAGRVTDDDFLFNPRLDMQLWRSVVDAFRHMEEQITAALP